MSEPHTVHKQLDCGIELAAMMLPHRRTVSAHIRYLVGFAHEPESKMGLNHVVEQTISKGTEQYSGQGLSDAFDALGVKWSSWAGREGTGYVFSCLPEFVDQTLALHAEFLRRPTFPQASVQVTIDNLVQEITNLGDDPHELSAKLFNRQVYGPVLGRHVLGEIETLRAISPEDIQAHWEGFYRPARMQVAVAGPLDLARLEQQLNECFADGHHHPEPVGRDHFDYHFEPCRNHHPKELEQVHIGICYPGAPLCDPRRYAQKVALGILSGGMSARLFTEVREKQGLVYWVTANTEHPRGIGIVYLGASTTPERCDRTYQTLLREIDRLGEDLEEDELQRAVTGIVARARTRGDITRSRCMEMSEDLFHFGKVIPLREKIARIQAVTIADVKAYVAAFSRTQLSVLTLGPRALAS